MHHLGPPNETTVIRNDTLKHMTLLRHPLLRLRDQYYADRRRDEEQRRKDVTYQGSHYETNTFEECAKSATCRHHFQFARWGNIQTKMLCGWNSSVCVYDKWLNATPAMLGQVCMYM